MGKLCIFVILCSIAMAAPVVCGITEGPKEVEEWFHKLNNNHSYQKVTKIHFYFHDLLGVTTAVVAQANTTATSPTFFGGTFMMDNPLTVGPSQASKVMGRAEGLYGSASKEDMSFIMAMNLVFTDGPYNGSSLTVMGRNPVLQHTREIPVIGGSGVFRLARGVALLTTYYFNVSSGNATVEYNVVVQHY